LLVESQVAQLRELGDEVTEKMASNENAAEVGHFEKLMSLVKPDALNQNKR